MAWGQAGEAPGIDMGRTKAGAVRVWGLGWSLRETLLGLRSLLLTWCWKRNSVHLQG